MGDTLLANTVDGLRRKIGDSGVLVLSATGLVMACLWVVATFFISGTKETVTKYYDLKLKYCTEAAQTAAKIATSANPATVRTSLSRFDELYFGELVLVEDLRLEAAMVRFRNSLPKEAGLILAAAEPPPVLPFATLRNQALNISRACFDLLQPTVVDQVLTWFKPQQKSAN